MDRGAAFFVFFAVLASLGTGAVGQARKSGRCPTNVRRSPFAAKIAGGSDAEFGRYPYMCSFQGYFSSTHFCGGTLISEDIVLTAAHCVKDKDLGFIKVQIGATELSDVDSEERLVCRAIIHEKYTIPELGYDIALVQLHKPSTKQTCKVATSNSFQRRAVRAIGWGANEKRFSLKRLQQVDLDLMRLKECAERLAEKDDISLKDFRFIDDRTMCANKNGRDVCNGDSGGPLMIADDSSCGKKDVLVGLTSFGIACDESLFYPGVFTKATGFLDWIRRRGAGESEVFRDSDCEREPPIELREKEEKEKEKETEKPEERKTDLAPAQEEGGCVFVEGIDFGKGPLPINKGKEEVFSTPQECCDHCKKTPGCKTWTYIRVKEKYIPKGACYLRSVMAPAIRCSICTSGLVREESQNQPEQECKFLLGMDFKGSDLTKKRDVKRVEECCAHCKANRLCKAATFHLRKGQEKGICYLKRGLGQLQICDECQSVVMNIAERASDKDRDAHLVLERMLPNEKQRINDLKQTTRTGFCRYTIGVDMVDKEGKSLLNKGREKVVGSPEDCCELCRNTKGCQSWTILTVPTTGKEEGLCFLRKFVLEEVPCAGCTSGVVGGFGTSSLADTSCALLEGVDLRGADLPGAGKYTDSPKDCCKMCDDTKGCKSWTRNNLTGGCWLKSKGAPDPVICGSCDSGVMMNKVTDKEIAPLHPVIKSR